MALNLKRDLAYLRLTMSIEEKLGLSVPNGEELVGWASLASIIASHISNLGVGFYQGFTRNRTPSPLCALTLGAGVVSHGGGNGISQAFSRASEASRASGFYVRMGLNDVRASDVLRGSAKGGVISLAELVAGAAVGYAVSTLFE